MAERHIPAPLATLLELAKARERRRIADGLHDDVGQVLVMARARLGLLRGALADERPGEAVAEVCSLLDHAITSMRAMTFELASSSPEPQGLAARIENLGRQIAESNGIRFRLRGELSAADLSGDAARIAYSAVRELLINVLKHAGAGSVFLDLARRRDRVVVTVRDDGRGFDQPRHGAVLPRGGGLGLARMREQVLGLGGGFAVSSIPGRGTRVTLDLPAGGPAVTPERPPETGTTPRLGA